MRRSENATIGRRFTILDAMILVAAVAGGLALGKTISGDALFIGRFHPDWSTRHIRYFLLGPTLAVLVLGLLRPRPPLKTLACRPGMAACLAATLATFVDAVFWAGYILLNDPEKQLNIVSRFWRGCSKDVARAVPVVWLGLLLGRRWRPDATWIDRLGRLLGVLWVVACLVEWRFGRWLFMLTFHYWKTHR